MTYEALIRSARGRLEAAGVPDAAADAFYLLDATTGVTGVKFYANPGEEVPEPKMEHFEKLLARRLNREPLQLILGRTYFFGREIRLDGNELIPRPDTELLVERALELTKEQKGLDLLDLCTGSGCIAIAIKAVRPDFAVTATDISEQALCCARTNAMANATGIDFRCGDLFAPIGDERFDVIVSNPPYIRSADIETLMPEVRDYDPTAALDGGTDGLALYRRIAGQAADHLKDGGRLLLEIGEDQAKDVSDLLAAAGFAEIKVCRDYADHDRVVSCKKE